MHEADSRKPRTPVGRVVNTELFGVQYNSLDLFILVLSQVISTCVLLQKPNPASAVHYESALNMIQLPFLMK